MPRPLGSHRPILVLVKLSVSLLLAAWLAVGVLAVDEPATFHLQRWSPLPANKLLLDVRDSFRSLHLDSEGCTSLDGPHCNPRAKQSLFEHFPHTQQPTAAKETGKHTQVKIKVIDLPNKPGQKLEEVLEEVLHQERERTSLAAETAALRSGKSAEEAHRIAEDASQSHKPVALAVENMDEIADVLQQVLAAMSTDPQDFLSDVAAALEGGLGGLEGGGGGSVDGGEGQEAEGEQGDLEEEDAELDEEVEL